MLLLPGPSFFYGKKGAALYVTTEKKIQTNGAAAAHPWRTAALHRCAAVCRAGAACPGISGPDPVFCPGETACGQRRPAFGATGYNPLPEDYTVELTTLSNGQQVASRIYPDLQAMLRSSPGRGARPVCAGGVPHRPAAAAADGGKDLRLRSRGLFPQKSQAGCCGMGRPCGHQRAPAGPCGGYQRRHRLQQPGTGIRLAGKARPSVRIYPALPTHQSGFSQAFPTSRGISAMWAARLPPRSMRRGCAWKNTLVRAEAVFGADPCRLAQRCRPFFA